MPGNGTYETTINTLNKRRGQLLAEIDALDKAIASLRSIDLSPASSQSVSDGLPNYVGSPKGGVYSKISIRWACLWVLSQAGKVGLSTATVAQLLVKGGRASKAERFASTVSAVLSNMKIKREIEQVGNYWILAATGEAALEAIRPRLEVLAREHLKYTEHQLRSMSDSKVRELCDINDQDYMEACDYYFGGANAATRPF